MKLSKLEEVLSSQPKYRIAQAKRAIFNQFIENWDEVSSLPKKIQQELNKTYPLKIDAKVYNSKDKLTSKAMIMLSDGNTIETVLMRHKGGRNTLCVSCMVGCPMNCAFCATGAMGLTRKLETDEVIIQALLFARILKKKKQRINSVVFMGMGEPLLNYENVISAIHILQSPDGFNIGARHISISTCGILDGIKRLSKESLPLNLAVSLHAPNDKIRQMIMPIARAYSIRKLIKTVNDYVTKTKRKVMFEYIMLEGINNSDENALELSKLIKNKLFFVNVIQYNPTGKFTPSSKNKMERFKNILEKNGITVTTRYKFGLDILGACGQLATKKK